jgi:hypothetical protein
MPDNETINRHIHEMLGKCWHEWPLDPADMPTMPCAKCGKRSLTWPETNPDYCSKKSPRELLEEAVDKAVEMVGYEKYSHSLNGILCESIFEAVRQSDPSIKFRSNEIAAVISQANEMMLTASAQQIATAIYHATKEGSDVPNRN